MSEKGPSKKVSSKRKGAGTKSPTASANLRDQQPSNLASKPKSSQTARRTVVPASHALQNRQQAPNKISRRRPYRSLIAAGVIGWIAGLFWQRR